jgi:hypothetical protein
VAVETPRWVDEVELLVLDAVMVVAVVVVVAVSGLPAG